MTVQFRTIAPRVQVNTSGIVSKPRANLQVAIVGTNITSAPPVVTVSATARGGSIGAVTISGFSVNLSGECRLNLRQSSQQVLHIAG
jgi:uncharacterized NAD(P)/FAD-binding protein YdhS